MHSPPLKVLAIGDVVGQPGIRILEKALPLLRKKWQPDFICANAENICEGHGITIDEYHHLIDRLGLNALTSGNHILDRKEYLKHPTPKLLKPANMFGVAEIKDGLMIAETASGVQIALLNLIGQVFMHSKNKSPFNLLSELLPLIPPQIRVILLDIHAEASSEKKALAYFAANRVSLVFGTHWHCPSADISILSSVREPNQPRTGYISDIGFTGCDDSVLGMDKQACIRRFLFPHQKKEIKLTPAYQYDKTLIFRSIFAEIDPRNGECLSLKRLDYSWDELEAV